MNLTLVSVDEYLHSSYEVDCGASYVRHYTRKRQSGIYPFLERRIRISSSRYRVPDLCVGVGVPHKEMQARIDDYLTLGVRHVRVIDPRSRRAYSYIPGSSFEVEDGILRTTDPASELPLIEIFDEIDAD
ncbi:MAG: Uma2 family endonuclease [Acidobacteriota bacterium]|nr:Uma2 family endonuclease [Acidobacteriota bacterium]